MKFQKVKTFFSTRGGKSVIVAVAMLLIAGAVYLNYRWFYDPLDAIGYGKNNMADNYTDSQPTDAAPTNESTYFTATALTRRQSRDEALDVLKMVSENDESSAEAKAEAAAQISRIAADIQNETNIETLVKAKGYEECVAVIGDDSVSVIVKAETMQAADAAQIFSIVYETTGISPEKISIIQK
ncbi:MAG: SpoIIIAH-like family protein [Clostridia bacterium]|nr:SpoIIIAH-like family protein [Clostridia bacterium]